MVRMQDTGAKVQELERLIAKLLADLRRFESIPQERREAECADEGERTCRALLRDLGVVV